MIDTDNEGDAVSFRVTRRQVQVIMDALASCSSDDNAAPHDEIEELMQKLAAFERARMDAR